MFGDLIQYGQAFTSIDVDGVTWLIVYVLPLHREDKEHEYYLAVRTDADFPAKVELIRVPKEA